MSGRFRLSLLIVVWFQACLASDVVTSARCPAYCVCADTVIVCTCADAPSNHTTLDSFRGIEYIGKIFIHSCRKLVIIADTFAGLAVGHEISITNVSSLTVQSYAFRDMTKCPDQLTVRDSGLELVAENAFAGFRQAKHVWFRNVSVGRIQTGAFRHLSDVQYLYFREANIGTLETGALGWLTNVSNVFMRGRLAVGWLGPALLKRSTFGKFVLEDAKIETADAHALVVGAGRFDSVELFNCRIGRVGTTGDGATFDPTDGGGRVHFFNVAVAGPLCMGAFSNVAELHFDQCRFDRLGASAMRLRDVRSVALVSSSVGAVDEGAFDGARRVGSIRFDRTLIDHIAGGSFASLHQVDYLMLLSTTVQTVHRSAFRDCSIGSLIVDSSRVQNWHSSSIESTTVHQLRVVDSRLGTVASGVFRRTLAGEFTFKRNNITDADPAWLADLHADRINVSENRFSNQIHFANFSFGQLQLTGNQFRCQCSTSWLDEMIRLEATASTPSHWTVHSNGCAADQPSRRPVVSFADFSKRHCVDHTDTANSIHWQVGPLRCSSVEPLLTECTCTATPFLAGDRPPILTFNTSVVRVGNCESLRLVDNLAGHARSVILHNSTLLIDGQVFSAMDKLVSLTVIDCLLEMSKESPVGFGTKNPLLQLRLENVTVVETAGIEAHWLGQTDVARLVIRNSQLGHWRPLTVDGARIGQLILNQNHFLSFNFATLSAIRTGQVDIVDNVIDHVEGVPAVENAKRLCFANNTVPCSQYQRLHQAIDSINNANNACKSSTNRCKHSLSNQRNDHFDQPFQSTGDSARSTIFPPLLWFPLVLIPQLLFSFA
ncbi:Slit -like protein 1 protein [Trichinella murrelli]|uniref:Slit-like protein 1 protein n=1 Tax=Trichinella murrelli TaxID=144512 RepID=A0A0V0U862_9BILA|nr:Slit -like protein 1 protein [Trichinella murrelli]